MEHSVDPIADQQISFIGLDVDVRGAIGGGPGDERVDELDDRRLVRCGLHSTQVFLFDSIGRHLCQISHRIIESGQPAEGVVHI